MKNSHSQWCQPKFFSDSENPTAIPSYWIWTKMNFHKSLKKYMNLTTTYKSRSQNATAIEMRILFPKRIYIIL